MEMIFLILSAKGVFGMEPMKNQLWTDKPRNFLGLAINFTRYIITSEKFITRKGFLNIHEDEIMLYRITDQKACSAHYATDFWMRHHYAARQGQ